MSTRRMRSAELLAELALRDGESSTRPGHCAMCGFTPCMYAAAAKRFAPAQLCYSAQVHPEPLGKLARHAADHVLEHLVLPASVGQWLPGTGNVLRAVAEQLLEWADIGDRAANQEAGR